MCGIFGFLKNKDCTTLVVDIIFQGLTELEQRGYDSVGCALFSLEKSLIIRSIGPVINLQNKYKKLKLNQDYDYAMAHTRWSTNGKITKANAHPHKSTPKGSFIVVHNGIIENYLELKEFLLQSDNSIVFHSETDTEVIGHLLEYLYFVNKQSYQNQSNRLEDYVLQIIGKTMNLLVGTYGLIIHCSETPGVLYAVKNGSSLIIGMNPTKGYFISSDLPTLRTNYASQVLALEDQQIAVVYSDHHEMHKIIFNQEEPIINTFLSELYSFQIPSGPFEEYQIANKMMKESKKKYKYHMLKEIYEQKQVIKNTTGGRITIEKDSTVIIKLGSFNDPNSKIIKLFLEEAKVQFLFLACGTSLHAGLFGKYLMEDFLGIPCSVECASEFLSKTNLIYKNTIVIALSQSGETADTVAAVKLAKLFQIETFGICNVVGSTLSRMVAQGIYTHAGIEQAVASTKAFIAQLCVLYILACYVKKCRSEKLLNQNYYYIQNKNNVNINQFLEFIKVKLPKLASQVLKQNQNVIQDIVWKYAHTMKAILFVGKSYFYPIALECALKIKETSYIHAEAYPAGEMKHGPIALIDSNVIVVFFIPDDFEVSAKMIHSVQEIKSRNGIIIIVISQFNLSQKEAQINTLADYIIKVPDVPLTVSNYILPLLSVIPFQLFSYYLAIEKGLNVDRPRNLAKSVTVF